MKLTAYFHLLARFRMSGFIPTMPSLPYAFMTHPEPTLKSDILRLRYHVVEQAMKAHRGSRGVSFFNLGARWGWVINVTHRPFYPRGRDPVPIV